MENPKSFSASQGDSQDPLLSSASTTERASARTEQNSIPPPGYQSSENLFKTPRGTPEYYSSNTNESKVPARKLHQQIGTSSQQVSKKSKPRAASIATKEDAIRAGIPTSYYFKNWDPAEEPVMLLGSVFDASSLGKWIYDWTVFFNGPATTLSNKAGELWLLLIQLTGKTKRAEVTMFKIRNKENRDMVDNFLESSERLWIRFAKLLNVCEDYIWKAAERESGEKKPVSMGNNSGAEFVMSIFGKDQELERAEKMMTGMRLWSMRFDAHCDGILRYPSQH